MRVCILGAGYVGSALAEMLSPSNTVIMFDPDWSKGAPNGQCLILHEKVPKEMEVYIICVPTPLCENGRPDHSFVVDAATMVRDAIKDSNGFSADFRPLVILESTVAVGTTRDLVAPIFEGLRYTVDVAFSPERISPGDKGIEDSVKVISGVDHLALIAVYNFYGPNLKVFACGSTEEAEMAKLLENTQRDVNIALMNELNDAAENLGISFQRVLAACRTKWNFADFKPGLVGGHCIAVDPHFLMDSFKIPLSMVSLARDINAQEPTRLGRQIYKAAKEAGAITIVVLGAGYKPNSTDTRNAGATHLVSWLKFYANRDFNQETGPRTVEHFSTLEEYQGFMEVTKKNVFTVVAVEDTQFEKLENVYRLYEDTQS
jgi:nucleotide sugar dehydrogenase